MTIAIRQTDEQRNRQTKIMCEKFGNNTVTIYDNNAQCIAYGTSARAIQESCGIALNDTKVESVLFPHSALDFYLPKLIRDGHKVVLLDD